MMRKIAAAIGYPKPPRAGYLLKHPVKGTRALAALYGRHPLLRGKAGLALGALVAAPVAYMAFRARRG